MRPPITTRTDTLVPYPTLCRSTEAAVIALDDRATHQTGGVHHIDHGQFAGAEDRGVEQQPSEHLLIVHGLRHMVDGEQPRVDSESRRFRLELDVPDLGQAPVDEIDHAAADPANRGDGKLAGPALL